MFKKFLLTSTMIAAAFLVHTSFADEQCNSDKECKDGQVCILAKTPHVCKDPQPAGESCKRDVVCASKKCDIPAGKEVGACK